MKLILLDEHSIFIIIIIKIDIITDNYKIIFHNNFFMIELVIFQASVTTVWI